MFYVAHDVRLGGDEEGRQPLKTWECPNFTCNTSKWTLGKPDGKQHNIYAQDGYFLDILLSRNKQSYKTGIYVKEKNERRCRVQNFS